MDAPWKRDSEKDEPSHPREVREAVAAIKSSYLSKLRTANAKRGWNTTFNQAIPGIRELTLDYNTRMRAINDFCVNLNMPSILAEEEPVAPLGTKEGL